MIQKPDRTSTTIGDENRLKPDLVLLAYSLLRRVTIKTQSLKQSKGKTMLPATIIHFSLAIAAGFLGLGGMATQFTGVVQICLFIFIVIGLFSLSAVSLNHIA